jgi:hypothetical protein
VVAGSLALGVWGGRYLGTPSVSAQKKTQDTHHHDHRHTEKPKAGSLCKDQKGQRQSKEHAHEAHEHQDEGHGHEKRGHVGHKPEHEHEEKVVQLSEERRKALGIEVATAQPGSLPTQLALSGTMTLNTDRLVRVVSRIPGIVREVRKNLGDFRERPYYVRVGMRR